MTLDIRHAIGGARTASASARTAPLQNPATGEETGRVPLGDAGDVSRAVAAARAALPGWAATPPAKRARLMRRFLGLVEENAAALARAISGEHGKTHADALGEVARGIEVIEYACGIPELLKGAFSRNVGPGIDAWSERAPVGVCVGITPFNFPVMVPLWMLPMATACGNAFILKPSETVPSAAMTLFDLWTEAGFPDGVFNVVHGDKAVVDALLAHEDVKAVSFVGSTPVAERVYAAATAAGKRAQCFGGAKNHLVVLPDADIEHAADALTGAAYGSAGERCMAVSVAVPVGEETADRLVAALKPRVEALRIGPADAAEAEMGPLVTRAHLDKVTAHIAAGVAAGAELVVDGRGFTLQGYGEGHFLGGSLFDRVTSDMSIYKREIFGPVLGVVRAATYEDAVRLVDAHEYGNGAAIFTRDAAAARDFAARVEIGMVGVNVAIPVPVGHHSFGGWKRSHFGDRAIYGPEAVGFYTRLKTVTARGGPASADGMSFAFPGGG